MSEMGGLESRGVTVFPGREYVYSLAKTFEQQRSVNDEQKINKGYKDLFKAIFASSPNPEVLSSKVAASVFSSDDLAKVKETVKSLFMQCTLIEPTGFYKSRDTGKTYEHWGLEYETTTLNPRDVYVLVERFGLANGMKKTYLQISESLGVSATRSQQITFKALRKIRASEAFKKLTSDIALYKV